MDGNFRLGGELAPYATSHAQIGNNDRMPTIRELSGKQIPSFVDGTSFVPTARDENLSSHQRGHCRFFSSNT